MTKIADEKSMKALRLGDVVRYSHDGERVEGVVIERANFCQCGCSKKDLEERHQPYVLVVEPRGYADYIDMCCNPIFVRKGATAKKERSDGFIFRVSAFSKKKKVVTGGCRQPGNVKAALRYWHDDYRVDEYRERIWSNPQERVRLNQESRKLVTQLAGRVDKKLAAVESPRKVAKKKKKKSR